MKHHIIRLSKSCLGPAEKKAVMGVLDREFLGMGTEVQQFETLLTEFFGRQTVCVVNGTTALQLALQACGIGAGDEVLVPSLTYVASFQAISATGAKPIACDVDAKTYTLDWHHAEQCLSSRTKAVMPVHYGGGVGDIDGLYAFAARHHLRVIEDAAHAFGTTHRGKKIGGFGDIACFSFDGIKNITCGEGGCVVTDDPIILQRIQDARLLGVEKDTEKRYTGQRSWEFDVTAQGWRAHMSNIMAAIGIEQLSRCDEMATIRRDRAKLYDTLFYRDLQIQPLQHDYCSVVPHIYVVRISGLSDRKALQARLLQRGIQTGVHYQPNHLLSFYRDLAAPHLPVTESLYSEILTLPLHVELSESDVQRVCEALKQELLNV